MLFKPTARLACTQVWMHTKFAARTAWSAGYASERGTQFLDAEFLVDAKAFLDFAVP
jgi:hypothetical protein